MKIHRLAVHEWDGIKRYELMCGRSIPKSETRQAILDGRSKLVVTSWDGTEEKDRCNQCRQVLGELPAHSPHPKYRHW